MGGRHAYMIMAHHRFEILKLILKDLDDERNNIFLHVDIKATNFDFNDVKNIVNNANLILVDRMDVHWGGFSQIKCVLNLLEVATKYEEHDYYHFMVGVEFPLKTQDYIHKFFSEHQGKEFIGFDNYDTKFYDRVRFYHIFNEYARNNNFFQKILNKIRVIFVNLQKILKVDIAKKYELEFRKGNANWSITHQLAQHIVNQKEQIYKIYRHSFCGDEVFIHTIIYNSKFYKNVYDINDEYKSSMRIMTWKDSKNQFHLKDVEMLIKSNRLFARKIDGDDAIEVINTIIEKR